MSGDAPHEASLLPNLWDETRAATLDEPGLLLYRSNLLGSDLRITNFGGGNTSAKVAEVDPLTGEYSKTAYIASFIGFAPASDPKLLCAVIVDEPKSGSIFGGTVAAPAFGQIMSFALPYLRIPPG